FAGTEGPHSGEDIVDAVYSSADELKDATVQTFIASRHRLSSAWGCVINLPMTDHLGVPAAVARRKIGDATDGALTTILIAVQQVHRELFAHIDHTTEVLVQRELGIAQRTLPISRTTRGYVQIDQLSSERVELTARVRRTQETSGGEPPMQD